MNLSDTTGAFTAPPQPPPTMPALPTPGIGATLLIAATVLYLRAHGFEDDAVDQWKADAQAAIRSPSSTIPPEY